MEEDDSLLSKVKIEIDVAEEPEEELIHTVFSPGSQGSTATREHHTLQSKPHTGTNSAHRDADCDCDVKADPSPPLSITCESAKAESTTHHQSRLLQIGDKILEADAPLPLEVKIETDVDEETEGLTHPAFLDSARPSSLHPPSASEAWNRKRKSAESSSLDDLETEINQYFQQNINDKKATMSLKCQVSELQRKKLELKAQQKRKTQELEIEKLKLKIELGQLKCDRQTEELRLEKLKLELALHEAKHQ